MAGFTCVDDVIAALSVNARYQRHWGNKAGFALTGNSMGSLWNLAGNPPAGAFGTALTARVIDSSFAAAIPFTNAGGGRQMHLFGATAWGTGAAGTLMLVDRLLEAPFNGTVTSGTFNSGTPLAIPARDEAGTVSGNGVFAFVENVANTTATARNLTLAYTNSSGVGGRSTGAQALGALGQHFILNSTQGWFLPLQAGDVGMSKIESYTLSGSMTTTQVNIVLCRPLLMVTSLMNSEGTDDLVLHLPRCPRLYDGTALQWLAMPQTTWSSTTPYLAWRIMTGEN